jgi:hypothetical protein
LILYLPSVIMYIISFYFKSEPVSYQEQWLKMLHKACDCQSYYFTRQPHSFRLAKPLCKKTKLKHKLPANKSSINYLKYLNSSALDNKLEIIISRRQLSKPSSI